MNDKQLIGSQTAKGGFENENDIELKFNNYKNDDEAKIWLKIMGYDWEQITLVSAIQIPPRISKTNALQYGATCEKIDETIKYKKSDVQIRIDIVKSPHFLIQKYNTEIKIIKKYTTIVDDGRETKKIEYYIRNKLLSNLFSIPLNNTFYDKISHKIIIGEIHFLLDDDSVERYQVMLGDKAPKHYLGRYDTIEEAELVANNYFSAILNANIH